MMFEEHQSDRRGAAQRPLLPGEPRRAGGSAGGSQLHRDFLEGRSRAVAAGTHLVRRVIHSRGYYIPPGERQDVLQDTLVDVLREARARDFATDADFCAFLRIVAHRRCVDWLRRKRAAERIDPGAVTVSGPDLKLLQKERERLGVRVLTELKEGCRTLFALHAGLGMTYGQIGQLTGRTEGALRTQLYQCLKSARKVLARLRRRRRGIIGPP